MPRGVWKRVSHPTDFALVRLPAEWTELALQRKYTHKAWLGNHERDTVKHVVARAGDNVAITAKGIEVNGALLSRSAPLKNDFIGRTMPEMRLARTTLAPGQFLVLSGDVENGFDSRYYGILDETRHLTGYALPVWVEERRMACLPPAP